LVFYHKNGSDITHAFSPKHNTRRFYINRFSSSYFTIFRSTAPLNPEASGGRQNTVYCAWIFTELSPITGQTIFLTATYEIGYTSAFIPALEKSGILLPRLSATYTSLPLCRDIPVMLWVEYLETGYYFPKQDYRC